ncbi:MAG TPA: PLP-dependent aminotransferase family protein [Verrucomicrobiae bacterium]|nr:PLP-dependent aminotransferase family protein [Verrucomicrobiae bacterium]
MGVRNSGFSWETKLARRTALIRRNSVREFLKFAGQPGIISFAGGLPAPEVFPLEEIQIATEAALRNYGAKALQYGQSEGIPELRALIAEPFREIGVRPENILITSGAQQALDILGRVLLNEGDRVLVENPTYLSALSVWRPLGVQFAGIKSDDTGLLVSEVCQSEGAKLLYTIPNFQNPGGTTLSLERREALAAYAVKQDLVVVEDDPYRELRYEGEELPTLLHLSGNIKGPIVHVGTFSKVLAPGFRLGWIIASEELIDRLVSARQAMDLHTGTFNQYVALELISAGVLERQVPKIRRLYRAKRDAMLSALTQSMPAPVKWTRPKGGMFFLASLPYGKNARGFARCALDAGVAVVPGEEFHVTGGENTFRLNFSHPNTEEIHEGIRKLAPIAAGFC